MTKKSRARSRRNRSKRSISNTATAVTDTADDSAFPFMERISAIAEVERKNSDPFSDIPEIVEIIVDAVKVQYLPTVEELNYIIDKWYPTWVCGTSIGFVAECEPIAAQWWQMCKQLNVENARIMLVEQTFIQERLIAIRKNSDLSDSVHQSVMKIADWYTARGYFVRDGISFSVCFGCKRAMMPIHYYGSMGFPSNGKCLKCNRRDPDLVRKQIALQLRERRREQTKE